MQTELIGEIRFLLGVLSLAVAAEALAGTYQVFHAVAFVLALLAAIGFFLEPSPESTDTAETAPGEEPDV